MIAGGFVIRIVIADLKVALLDDTGCAKLKQSISGSIDRSRIGVVSAADPLPARSSIFTGKQNAWCKAEMRGLLYGSLQQPR